MENGNCGYVLKPGFTLYEVCISLLLYKQYNNLFQGEVQSPSCKLQVHVISGHQIPKPDNALHGEIIDPLVEVHINGIPKDTKHFETRNIDNNGFNPVWNEVLWCC